MVDTGVRIKTFDSEDELENMIREGFFDKDIKLVLRIAPGSVWDVKYGASPGDKRDQIHYLLK